MTEKTDTAQHAETLWMSEPLTRDPGNLLGYEQKEGFLIV